MTSIARKNFDKNAKDLGALIELHDYVEENLGSLTKKQASELEVLLRSTVVLLVSYWEAYVEDICTEALDIIIEKVTDPSKLPKELRKVVADEVKSDANELRPWDLAGDGWKELIKIRAQTLAASRNRSFNTPKSEQTKEFIGKTLGIKDISQSWSIKSMQPKDSATKLNELVSVRGEIAHRGLVSEELTKDWVIEQIDFVGKLVAKTGGAINTHVKKTAGAGLW